VNSQPASRRPDWVSKLVLPIAAAVVGAILVTALTPLGENLRELLFPTKADVSGSVTVDGRPAAGARLVLDGEPVTAADDEGTFVVRDVGDGDHTLEIKAVSSKLKRQPFTVERRASEQALGEIRLRPLAQLGYYPSVGASFEGLTFDVTLWIIAERDVLDRIASVQYTLPGPFPPTVVTVRNAPARAFCLRRKSTFQSGGGVRNPSAVVDLGDGRTFSISSQGGGQPGTPACPITGGGAGGSGSSGGGGGGSGGGGGGGGSGGGGGGGGGGGPLPPPPSQAIVPAVTSRPYEEAQALLQSRGFRVSRKDVVSDESVGTVVAQSPAAGTSRPKGSSITLSVSSGPPVDVPDVTGLRSADARQKLEGSGFKVTERDKATSDPADDGVVLEQSPAGGEKAGRGTTVTIIVGRLGG
jgi:PASTA domain